MKTKNTSIAEDSSALPAFNETQQLDSAPASPSRRQFLGKMSAATAATIATGITSASGLEESAFAAIPNEATTVEAELVEIASGNLSSAARAQKAYDTRVQAALFQKISPRPEGRNNGDEDLYNAKIANFSKGLRHNSLGEVERNSWESFMQAIRTGDPDEFERIAVGGTLQLKNPQAGLTYEMVGSDTAAFTQPPAPAFSSAEIAAEIAENYWMALTRDVNFLDYATNPLTVAAAQDLSRFSDFRGPKFGRASVTRPDGGLIEGEESAGRTLSARVRETQTAEPVQATLENLQISLGYRQRQASGSVTTNVLFRGLTAGDLVGPYISQFLWKDAPFGAQTISGRMRTVPPGTDYLTNYGDWLAAQNGSVTLAYPFDPTPRYIRNGRDLAEWVHIDVLYQAYFNAMLFLLGTGVPVDSNNPYRSTRVQCGFGTFGPPHIAALLPSVATAALRTVWYQKWFVHRRLRPEAFAGRVHNTATRAANYPVHPEILNSAVLPEVQGRHGSFLLPMAFPEGCPAHPAYGAGHATVAGACVTILKAWFDESYVLPDPVVATADGLALVPYRGSDNLTVGGELNKLASNVALGRNIGGVHWRSDATESLKLGEAVAISILLDLKTCFNEHFDGFSLTKFDGTRITI
ncbi:MAG: vanadium-dependent haloperoxidase [Acidobacteria bacterium]|nr:vanadium-dependent haloperoxidase [Acidobacteriota bacterium]